MTDKKYRDRYKERYRGRYAKPEENTQPAHRKCLSCGKMFGSWGIANRRCEPCKKRSVWHSGHHAEAYPQGLTAGGGYKR